MQRPFPSVPLMLTVLWAPAWASDPRNQADPPAPPDVGYTVVAGDDFRGGSSAGPGTRWVVEQQPGGSVMVHDGCLVIEDAAGCTVWWREKLTAPVAITFEATVTRASRVSDLNCFWMASDPARPGDLFATGHTRDGTFASYDTLRTYYVGYGGNNNSTTRFRRYDGTGARPLLPEHDRSAPEFLLVPDKTYSITVVAEGGHARYFRDGELVFDFADPSPLTEGWFGLRTVHSHIEVRHFQVRKPGAN